MPSICLAQELKNSAEDAKSKTPRPLAGLLGSKRKPETEARSAHLCPAQAALSRLLRIRNARFAAAAHIWANKRSMSTAG